ncbi:MAG: hypothetical protein U1E05_16730 [Patescibacteria group bacterium]|nr:hypothetical protein [Patescibacteria group bacterium]
MFQLHDRTRRRIAVGIFVALCIAPTLLILLWGLNRQMPWHTAAEVRRLAAVLGLQVQADRVSNTKPGQWHYDGLSVSDPETGRQLFRCEQLEVSHAGGEGSSPATLVLHARKPVTDALGVATLFQLLSRAMQGQMSLAPVDLQWTADSLVFDDAEEAILLQSLAGGTQLHPDGVQAQLRFQLAEGAGAEPSHIEIHRNRLVSPAGLELKLYTGAAPLPSRLLAVGLPAFAPLGPDCRFRGYLRADQTPNGWVGELTGHFSEVDLGRLVRDQFHQHLTGTGQVTVERAGFDRGRVQFAWGTFTLGPGTIARPLLDAAVEQMSLIRNALPEAEDEWIPYRQFAANWRLSAEGLLIEGRCDSAVPGTLLAGTSPWHVGEPVVQPVPVTALVRTLVPNRSPEIPATAPAEWLMRHLPLPEASRDAVDRHSTERLR